MSAFLYLSRADVVAAGGSDLALYRQAVTHALILHAQRALAQPLKLYLRWPPDGHIADRLIAMPAYLGGDNPVAGLKWVGSKHDNPERAGLDRASALTVLNDAATHYPIAVMEGGLISALRTAAVTVVAASHLARPRFGSISCIGCGPIGRAHVLALVQHFPSVHTTYLYDLRPYAAKALAAELCERHPVVDVRVAGGAEEAVRAAEVVVTCTLASEPWLPWGWLQKGSFLSNVSLMDAHGDVFLHADKVVVDDWDQCAREGKVLHQLATAGSFSRDQLHAELSQIVVGERAGREDDDEIILLNPMGIAAVDVACAQAVYERARQAGIGTWLPL